MADFDFQPPSFSLGLDLDLDSEPHPAPPPNSIPQPAKRAPIAASLRTIEEDNDDFESPVRVSDPPRSFKRLRRGPTARVTPETRNTKLRDGRCHVDDEIEGFSSEEDCSRAGSIPSNSGCSSSKPSLFGQSAVTTESGSQWRSVKGKEVSSASASATVEKRGSSLIFPQLTVSPLRRFQLIDSDSDDPPLNSSPKEKESDSLKHGDFRNLGAKKESVGKYEKEDLWRDFCSGKSTRVPTPVFDEFCEEYFTNAKTKNKPETNLKNTNNGKKSEEGSLPSAHCYFFHDDSRIQKLVRDRLPYFFPLGAVNNQEYTQQQNSPVIDYMGQFGHEDNSRKTVRKNSAEKGPTRSKRNAKKTHDSENWVNPKSGAGLQKNAGSRRVQAVSDSSTKSSGHWYTGSDGRRVYVSKKGQELTGKIAYMNYKKESGTGFTNSKKKGAAKKKTAAKKSTSNKK
ncbi:hypothetical protein ABFS83_13G167800 [Erythranthe nasuta]